nr:aspartate aminotransferase family protein [uncultured Niameybacter sp.]
MIKEDESKYVMHTYNRFNIALDHGEGCYIYDEDNKKYLDMGSGIAVSSLGYNHPVLSKALEAQLHKLLHTSNLYYTKPQVEAARLLIKYSDFDKVFFCNSGAEANEAAIKIARKYGSSKSKDKVEIITLEGGFHGRTYGSLTATAQEKYQAPFKPLVPGFSYAKFNDLESMKELISEKTCAVIVEVIQGESGIHVADSHYLQEVEKLCKQYDVLLIIDEVQTGMGRTGSLFAYSQFGIQPDIVTTAKGLGAGLPIGAVLAKENANILLPGDHGTTFGGNLLATTAAKVVLTTLCEEGILTQIQEISEYLKSQLEELKLSEELIVDVRGKGLMLGVELSVAAKPVIDKCVEKGLLLIGAGEKVIRFLPPLILEKAHVDEAIEIFQEGLK